MSVFFKCGFLVLFVQRKVVSPLFKACFNKAFK